MLLVVVVDVVFVCHVEQVTCLTGVKLSYIVCRIRRYFLCDVIRNYCGVIVFDVGFNCFTGGNNTNLLKT